MRTRILLWYSGDGDVSQHIHRLTERHGEDVVTLTLDLGQGRDLEEIRDRALTAGAVRAHVLDVREEFARDFVLPSLRAGVSPAGPQPFAVALGQPLVARKLIEIAAIEGARSVAHGVTGEDRMRLEASLTALDDEVLSIALPHATGASELGQANLWGRVRGVKTSPAKSLDTPASVDVAFERGVPTAHQRRVDGAYRVDRKPLDDRWETRRRTNDDGRPWRVRQHSRRWPDPGL